MPIEITHWRDELLEPAAGLAARRYARLRDRIPLLPPQYATPDTMAGLLAEITTAAPAAVAQADSRVVGFLAGWRVPSLHGKRAIFSPEWANAAEWENERIILEELYTWMAGQWARDRYHSHYISTLADDHVALQTWTWLGMGMHAVDAIRDLTPLDAPPPDGVTIRRATPADATSIVQLDQELQQHLAGAPAFHWVPPDAPHPFFAELGRDSPVAWWVAEREGVLVGLMGIGPASEDAAAIIVDKGTASIRSTYVTPAERGRGIAAALLDRCLAWACDRGYTRCHVDLEAANTTATRFWLRYFQPVAYTLARNIA